MNCSSCKIIVLQGKIFYNDLLKRFFFNVVLHVN